MKEAEKIHTKKREIRTPPPILGADPLAGVSTPRANKKNKKGLYATTFYDIIEIRRVKRWI
jgi:hypothetical protein